MYSVLSKGRNLLMNSPWKHESVLKSGNVYLFPENINCDLNGTEPFVVLLETNEVHYSNLEQHGGYADFYVLV